MIITRTPLRVSFLGGGTDMPEFYNHHPGMVISTAINKYIYVSVNPKFDGRYRVSYSVTENVDNASEIKHDIVREVMKLFEVKGLEVVSVSDIPGEGSGLGSSSSFTVGLLRAMYEHCGYSMLPEAVAEHAFQVERDYCGHTIGKQDAYAAAYGGFRAYEFVGKKAQVDDIGLFPEDLAVIESSMLLFWTDLRKSGESEIILQDQGRRLENSNMAAEAGIEMVSLVTQLRQELKHRQINRIGKFVLADWIMKRKLSGKISNEWIDMLISHALQAGADGAKICGAGGGGFLLVMASPTVHRAVVTALGLREVDFRIGAEGSKVIWKGE